VQEEGSSIVKPGISSKAEADEKFSKIVAQHNKVDIENTA